MSNSSIWPRDRFPIRCRHTEPSGPGNDSNLGVLCIPPKLCHYWSLTIRLFYVICRTLVMGVLSLCRHAVGIFYCPPANWATPLWVITYLSVMVMKCYSTLPRPPELESYYLMQFSVISKIFVFVGGDTASV